MTIMRGTSGAHRIRPANLVLLIVVAAGAVVRYCGIAFGLPHTETRPDESRIINLAIGIASGRLNPHYFVYPTLYMYLLGAQFRIEMIVRHLATVDLLPRTDLFVGARCVTAAFGSATVLAVYAVGKRVQDELGGILAAGLLAFAFLHVRDSHFGTTDVPMTFGVLLSLMLLLAPDLRRRRLAFAGLIAGLAASVKYNAVLLPAVAVFLEVHAIVGRKQSWSAATARLALFGGSMAVGFLIGTPFAVVDGPAFLSGLSFVRDYVHSGHMHNGRVLAFPHAGWRYLSFLLPAAVGWPVFVMGLLGLGLVIWQKPKEGIACVVFPVLYFLTAAQGVTVFARYMVPVVPFLCLGAGYLISVLVAPLRERPWVHAAAIAGGSLIIVPSAINVIRLDVLLTRPDNRLIVGSWIEQNIEKNRSIWQSGSRYGRVQFFSSSAPTEWTYDEETGRFQSGGVPVADVPEYILIQRSPLTLYSSVPESVSELLKSRYILLGLFKSGITALRESDFDTSDAFFLPLDHLSAMRRPGPEFELYGRRVSSSPNAERAVRKRSGGN